MKDAVLARHQDTIDTLVDVSGSLSLGGCTFVLVAVLLSKKLFDVPALRLLVFVSGLNWWLSVAYFLSEARQSATCQFVGFLQQFCHLSTALWMVCLAINQHRGIVLGLPNADKFEVFYHAACWGLPLLTCVALWAMDAFGEAKDFHWCWVRDDEEVARWVLFHAPLVLCMAVTAVLMLAVLRVLNKRRHQLQAELPKATIFSHIHFASVPLPVSESTIKRASVLSHDTISTANKASARHKCATATHVELKVQRQMIYLTFSFVILRVPWVCKAMYTAGHDHQLKGLVLAEAVTSPLLGFLVFALFVSNSQVRRHFRRLRRKGLKGLKNVVRGHDTSRFTLMSEMKRGSFGQGGDKEVGIDALALPRAAPATTPQSHALRVFVGSWNLGNAPPEGDLGQWIPTDGYDVWAIGVQESSWSAAQRKHNAPHDFFGVVQDHMKQSNEPPTTLACVTLWDIRLVVMVRAGLADRVENVEMGSEACGLGKVLGNKGAVGVCFEVGETCLCFVNSHLAARSSRIKQRNGNVRDILRGLRLRNRRLELSTQAHYLFWLGDLNYRINLPRERAIAHIRAHDIAPLLAADQLAKEINAGRVFTGFHEGEISFTPTYRFERGSREFSNKKNQTPSYCDRVLYRVLPQGSLTQHHYSAYHGLMSSDHSPVAASFTVQLIDAPFVQTPRDDGAVTPKKVQKAPVDADRPNDVMVLASQMPARFNKPSTYVITVSDVRIVHIHPLKHRVDGAADPYLRFVPSWDEEKVLESSSKKRTIDPSWVGLQMPSITFKGSFEELCRKHVTMLCLDLGLRGEEDLLGSCVIPPSLGLAPEPVPFRALLTRQTRRVGAVFGRVHVVDFDEKRRSGSVSAWVTPAVRETSASAAPLVAPFDYVGSRPSDAEGEQGGSSEGGQEGSGDGSDDEGHGKAEREGGEEEEEQPEDNQPLLNEKGEGEGEGEGKEEEEEEEEGKARQGEEEGRKSSIVPQVTSLEIDVS